MDDLTVIVLAAGGGTRMKSKTAKVLHPISGLSMVGHVLRAVNSLEPATVVAVVGHQRDQVGPHIEAELPGVVKTFDADRVTIDFNHPLAGKTLRFEVEILAVRPL